MNRRRHTLVLAIYLQTRGFAFALFEGWLAPVDWAVHDIRGRDKNSRSWDRIDSLFALHTPDVVVLEEMSDDSIRRVRRIQRLNRAVADLAVRSGITVRTYSRRKVRDAFAYHYGATTKQQIAEIIAKRIPALNLYVPPARRPWMGEHARMGIFEAAALAWMYFHDEGQQRHAAP